MATSFEAFPPPGLDGTTVYPAADTSSYHSGGSYGTVFVVLGVIVVVSVVACVMGRFCGGKRSKKTKHNQSHAHGNNKNNSSKMNKGRERERDVEFGFGPKGAQLDFRSDNKISKGKVAPNGYGKQGHNGPGPGHFSGPPMGSRQLQLPMMECPRN